MSATRLAAAGYGPLVSVIPPKAKLSARSQIKPEMLGKVPGRQNANGTWGGYDFLAQTVDPNEIARTGANVGLLGAKFPALDIDTTSAVFADAVVQLAFDELGEAPVRLSREPRKLLVYRASEPFGRVALTFQVPGGPKHVVEFLGDGRQYLVAGTHPSGQAYRWRGFPLWESDPEDLPLITGDRAVLFLETLRDTLAAKVPNATITLEGKGAVRVAPPQNDLEAPSLDELRSVVARIPNTAPSRDEYVRMAFAIKAAGAPWPGEAFEVFEEWARRWEDGQNTDEEITTRWESLRPPFKVGWRWILDRAAALKVADVPTTAQYEFEAGTDSPPPLPRPKAQDLHAPLRWSEWRDEHIPPPIWCVEDLVERGTRGVVFGPGGSGKSWFGYAVALQLAHGSGDVLGHLVEVPHNVYFVRAEGARRDTQRCLKRLERAKDLPLNDRLVIDHAGYDLTKPERAKELVGNVRRAFPRDGLPVVLMFDPWSQLLGGASDSDPQAKLAMENVNAIHRALGEDATVVIIHHVRKKQQGVGADKRPTMRGLSEFRDWADFAIGMDKIREERENGDRPRKIVVTSELWNEKQREMGFDDFAARLSIMDDVASYDVVSSDEWQSMRDAERDAEEANKHAKAISKTVEALQEHVGETMNASALRALIKSRTSHKNLVRDALLRGGQIVEAGTRAGSSRMYRVTDKVNFKPEVDEDGFGEA